MRSPFVRIGELSVLGVAPVLATVLALITFSDQGRLALDFHHELYPEAALVVDGENPFPAPDADLSDGTNTVWPIAAVAPVIPFTLVDPAEADALAAGLALACLVATLWLLGIRDWRIYGVTLLWPAVIDGYQTANLTLPLGLLMAAIWRYRDNRAVTGSLLGIALATKFFLWPVVAWLVATGRRGAAGIALVVAGLLSLALLPFIGILDYVRLLRNLAETFDQHAYTPYAVLLDLGLPSAAARGATVALGVVILALAWRRRSLGLALGAALVLSPIVWRHFFALLAVPLAVAHPRFGVAWLLPLGLWLVPGGYNGATWQTLTALVVGGVTLAVCEGRHQPGVARRRGVALDAL